MGPESTVSTPKPEFRGWAELALRRPVRRACMFPPILQGTLEFSRSEGLLAENSTETSKTDHDIPKCTPFSLSHWGSKSQLCLSRIISFAYFQTLQKPTGPHAKLRGRGERQIDFYLGDSRKFIWCACWAPVGSGGAPCEHTQVNNSASKVWTVPEG